MAYKIMMLDVDTCPQMCNFYSRAVSLQNWHLNGSMSINTHLKRIFTSCLLCLEWSGEVTGADNPA